MHTKNSNEALVLLDNKKTCSVITKGHRPITNHRVHVEMKFAGF